MKHIKCSETVLAHVFQFSSGFHEEFKCSARYNDNSFQEEWISEHI